MGAVSSLGREVSSDMGSIPGKRKTYEYGIISLYFESNNTYTITIVMVHMMLFQGGPLNYSGFQHMFIIGKLQESGGD